MQITDYFSSAFEMLKTQTNKINVSGLGFTVSIMQLTPPEAVLNLQQVWAQTDSSTDSVATLEDIPITQQQTQPALPYQPF